MYFFVKLFLLVTLTYHFFVELLLLTTLLVDYIVVTNYCGNLPFCLKLLTWQCNFLKKLLLLIALIYPLFTTQGMPPNNHEAQVRFEA